MEKIVVVGSGVAGLTAAIYAAREGFAPLVIDSKNDGGKIALSPIIANWPGEIQVDGGDLMKRIRLQAEQNGVRFLNAKVEAVNFLNNSFELNTSAQKLFTKSLIVATGSRPRRLGCPGESSFFGKGVSFSSAYDKSMLLGKHVVVVGSRDVAIQTISLLNNYAAKITLIFLGSEPTATDPLKKQVLNLAKLELLPQHKVVEIVGFKDSVNAVKIAHEITGASRTIATDQVLIAIGMQPNSELFQGFLDLDGNGFIVVNDFLETSVAGIFACGDVLKNSFGQAIVGAGQGCQAALSASRYLRMKA